MDAETCPLSSPAIHSAYIDGDAQIGDGVCSRSVVVRDTMDDGEAEHGPPPRTLRLKEGLWRRRFTRFAVNNNMK
jgi:hypothetical protein